ncbi:hypothetical protein CL622_08345 [archaeon]|nr:hypothetical protein [archaeon]|tara:strand:- start:171 stop:356 length:186 start_codon:yes stop_codon:yes gene_type:complete
MKLLLLLIGVFVLAVGLVPLLIGFELLPLTLPEIPAVAYQSVLILSGIIIVIHGVRDNAAG